MAKTRHIQKRMAQRGIKDDMLNLATRYGVKQGDRCILNRKACDALLAEINQIRKSVIKARERGGYVVVEVQDSLITTYALDSYSRRKTVH